MSGAAGRRIVFLTHAEVEIDPNVPVPDWPLNPRGRERHAGFDGHPVLAAVTAIHSSRERKARDAAAIHAGPLGLPVAQVTALHENDRSATGFLSPEAFERHADAFFARPQESVGGWERSCDAQRRIAGAVRRIAGIDASVGDILIVSHGAVGALLRCDLLRRPITRAEDQPKGGGCWFLVDIGTWTVSGGWTAI